MTQSTGPARALVRLKQAVWRVPAAPAAPTLAVIVRQHQGMVRGFLRRLCEADAIAEDIAQETFLKVGKGLASYRGDGTIASWVLRIAYREFLGWRRKRPIGVLVDDIDQVDDSADRAADRSGLPNPDRTMERDVRRALRLLSDDERVAVAACFFEDLTHDEAAAALGIPLGTLKSQVARAKEKLRGPLAAYNTSTTSGDTP